MNNNYEKKTGKRMVNIERKNSLEEVITLYLFIHFLPIIPNTRPVKATGYLVDYFKTLKLINAIYDQKVITQSQYISIYN